MFLQRHAFVRPIQRWLSVSGSAGICVRCIQLYVPCSYYDCSLLDLLALRKLSSVHVLLFTLNSYIAVYKPKIHTNSRPHFYNGLLYRRRGIFLCKYDHFSQQYVHMNGFFFIIVIRKHNATSMFGRWNRLFYVYPIGQGRQ